MFTLCRSIYTFVCRWYQVCTFLRLQIFSKSGPWLGLGEKFWNGYGKDCWFSALWFTFVFAQALNSSALVVNCVCDPPLTPCLYLSRLCRPTMSDGAAAERVKRPRMRLHLSFWKASYRCKKVLSATAWKDKGRYELGNWQQSYQKGLSLYGSKLLVSTITWTPKLV